MWRKLKHGYRKFIHFNRVLSKIGIVCFVVSILLLQFHTLITLQKYHDGLEHEGDHFRFDHHGDYDDGSQYIIANNSKPRTNKLHNIVLSSMQARENLNSSLKNTHHLSIRSRGRLGNEMFAYASLLGIAMTNDMIPVLPADSILRKYFHISAKPCDEKVVQKSWPKFHDKKHSGFDNRTMLLNFTLDIELVGHFQSWKYFSDAMSKIQSEFTFQFEIETAADEWMKNALYQNVPPETLLHDVTYVGLHIRRGDLQDPSNVEKGYTMATRDYVVESINYFEKRFDPTKLVFFVCSDDMVWVKTNLRRQQAPMLYSLFHDPIMDLAILSKCHHMITTVGSFSWWAGFLSGGTTVYYANYPRPGSLLAEQFSSRDYFMPDWIGL